MVAYSTYSHHFGSGVFSSLMPSHSCPVVVLPVTRVLFDLGRHRSTSPVLVLRGIGRRRSKRALFFGQKTQATIADEQQTSQQDQPE